MAEQWGRCNALLKKIWGKMKKLIYILAVSTFILFVQSNAVALKKEQYCAAGASFDDIQAMFCWRLYGDPSPWVGDQSGYATGAQLTTGEFLRVRTNVGTLPSQRKSKYLPTGRLVLKHRSLDDEDDEFVRWCTASVISEKYILTAWHCPYMTDAEDIEKYYLAEAQLRMNFVDQWQPFLSDTFKVIRPSSGCAEGTEWPEEAICAVEGKSKGDDGDDVDYAILEISNGKKSKKPASESFGTLKIKTDADYFDRVEMIHIPQHPRARWLMLDYGDTDQDGKSKMRFRFRHNAITHNMSSGAPILDAFDGELVGLHLAAGLAVNQQHLRKNQGAKINEIVSRSPILQEIVASSEPEISNQFTNKIIGKNHSDNALADTPRLASLKLNDETSIWTTKDDLVVEAVNGNARAQWELGSKFIRSQRDNFRLGILPLADESFFSECDQNDYELEWCRVNALFWFELASDNDVHIDGTAQAITDIGDMIYSGQNPKTAHLNRCGPNTPEPCLRALENFSRAADAEYREAYTRIGMLHYYGYGVERQLKTAAKYFAIGYRLQSPEATLFLAFMSELDELAEFDLPAEILKKSPLDLYHESADYGYPVAAYRLGRIYYYGTEYQKPIPEVGLIWFEAAAQKENKCAIYELDKINGSNLVAMPAHCQQSNDGRVDQQRHN